ncbi:MAG: hypothetical protein FWE84_05900, partial [Firmicutes bacterium]|nr:hypothetical protein [Bacillota bacterium]
IKIDKGVKMLKKIIIVVMLIICCVSICLITIKTFNNENIGDVNVNIFTFKELYRNNKSSFYVIEKMFRKNRNSL